jgi:tripartite-type tricarboxylate transporter receptor subunit TctC
MFRLPLSLMGVVFLVLGSIISATGQDYPLRPVRIVLPVPAGTALDVVTRMIGDHLAEQLGQRVIVENRAGANGLRAVQAVASSASDGYTLLGGASSIWTLPMASKDAPPAVDRGFRQVALISGPAPMYLAVSPRLGIGTFAEFVALARAKPGGLVVGTNAAGTLPHFAGLALAKSADIPLNIVPYNEGGTVAAVADIRGGHIDATIEAIFGLRGALQSGDLILAGVMSKGTDPLHPELPIVAATIPGFSAVGFMTLAAPAGVPDAVVARLNAAIRNALEAPAVRQRFAELGIPRQIMTPGEVEVFVAAERDHWRPIVREFEAK